MDGGPAYTCSSNKIEFALPRATPCRCDQYAFAQLIRASAVALATARAGPVARRTRPRRLRRRSRPPRRRSHLPSPPRPQEWCDHCAGLAQAAVFDRGNDVVAVLSPLFEGQCDGDGRAGVRSTAAADAARHAATAMPSPVTTRGGCTYRTRGGYFQNRPRAGTVGRVIVEDNAEHRLHRYRPARRRQACPWQRRRCRVHTELRYRRRCVAEDFCARRCPCHTR